MWKRMAPAGLAAAAGVAVGWMLATRTTADPAADFGKAAGFYFPTSETPSEQGKTAGAAMQRTLLTGDPSGCSVARATWDEIGATENFGFEYASLAWLCDYVTAAPERRAELLGGSADGRRVVGYFDGAGWTRLSDYLGRRYEIPQSGAGRAPMMEEDFGFVQELLCFGGPGRAAWERPEEIVRLLDIRPGMAIADLGAGTGYMTYRFSDAVGADGKVYALDIFARLLTLIQQIAATEGRTNIQTVHNGATDLALPADSVDLVWICNVYHQFYGSTREGDRAALIASIHDVLRSGGRLVILENTPEGELPPGVLHHAGHTISSRLVIAQLTAYGFRFKTRHSLIPQRYILEFEEA